MHRHLFSLFEVAAEMMLGNQFLPPDKWQVHLLLGFEIRGVWASAYVLTAPMP
jgi:hypothetical protein